MIVLSLFDESGNMLRPWAEAGHTCYAVDILNLPREEKVGSGKIIYLCADLSTKEVYLKMVALRPDIVFGFPPCTDLAVSGARHFEAKELANPYVFKDAMQLVMFVVAVGTTCKVPWMFENPVSIISSLYRRPDYKFHPWEFGGYLSENDVHPRWPRYIAARDAYPKNTCIWCGNGFRFPEKKPVYCPPGWSTQTTLLGGKSAKTKQIRSETARGFAQAVFEANSTLPISVDILEDFL